MSTAMNFGSKTFKPRAPDKGSFPLDHFERQVIPDGPNTQLEIQGECKLFKEKFMKCLRGNGYDNSLCRQQSKEYLECRMERQLMAKEPLEKLGFKDLVDTPPQTSKDPKP